MIPPIIDLEGGDKKMEINILPKFIDEAATPVAQSVGNTVSGIWNLVFGNHVSLWLKKQEYKHQQNYEDFLKKVNTKVENIPPENIKEPEMHILGPAIEASKYYIHSEELRDIFANLIAASMNSEKADTVHPSYIEIIKQLSPDEAILLKFMKGGNFSFYNVNLLLDPKLKNTLLRNFSVIGFQAECKYPENITVYLDNLSRLGLVVLDNTRFISDQSKYDEIEQNSFFKESIEYISPLGNIEKQKGYIESTLYGINFYKTCIS